MPHLTQALHEQPAVAEFLHNGDHSSNEYRSTNGHRRSKGHVPTDGQGRSAPLETETQLVDGSALLAKGDDRDGAVFRAAVAELPAESQPVGNPGLMLHPMPVGVP